MDLHPSTHVQLNFFKDRCLGYVVFECHANSHINWESFAHRDQQKTCLRYATPKLRSQKTSSFGS